jgi:hypothetical protein
MADPIDRDAKRAIEVVDRDDRALSRDEDLPVVARLVIEIRSDGSRTVARGAMEDTATGSKTAVVARGGSPLALAADLTRALGRTLTALPRGTLLRALLGRGKSR